MPPKHKKKLTESEILESLTKPDLSIDQTAETLKDDSLKDSDDELPAININPTAKKTKRLVDHQSLLSIKKLKQKFLLMSQLNRMNHQNQHDLIARKQQLRRHQLQLNRRRKLPGVGLNHKLMNQQFH